MPAAGLLRMPPPLRPRNGPAPGHLTALAPPLRLHEIGFCKGVDSGYCRYVGDGSG